MANQLFDFESFKRQFGPAISGLQDVVAECKSIVPSIQEVSTQTGSQKLGKTTDSFIEVVEQLIACLESVEESAEDVSRIYNKIDSAVN